MTWNDPSRVGLHVGEDGWLFSTGSRGEVASLLESADGSQATTAGWADLLRDRVWRAQAIGSRYFHVLVPDKLCVYGDRSLVDWSYATAPSRSLPQFFSQEADSVLEHAYIDLLGELKSYRDVVPMYWQTSSLWTAEGAEVAYSAICTRIGVPPRAGLLGHALVERRAPLELGQGLPDVHSELWRRYVTYGLSRIRWSNEAARSRWDEEHSVESVACDGVEIWYENVAPLAYEERILVVGDAYCDYRPYLLTGFLAGTFRNVFFSWRRSIQWDWMPRFRPTVIISVLAERSHANVPVDSPDPWETRDSTALALHDSDGQ